MEKGRNERKKATDAHVRVGVVLELKAVENNT